MKIAVFHNYIVFEAAKLLKKLVASGEWLVVATGPWNHY